MNTKITGFIAALILQGITLTAVQGQTTDSAKWSLQKCIEYALQENIQVKQTSLTNDINQEYVKQSKAARFPSLSASASENVAWKKSYTGTEYTGYNNSKSTSYSVGSSVTLFNGLKINNSIKQSEKDYEAGTYNLEATKELIGLSVLSAYLQVLYSQEQVNNSQKQVETTEQQLRLAEERFRLGSISKSDYLQVKSELSTEKLTLANAQSQLGTYRVTLMQLLEIPVSEGFQIENPNLDNFVNNSVAPDPDSVYNVALNIKPQVKSAQLSKESSELEVKIARAGYMPRLSLNADLSTGYSNTLNPAYNTQVQNGLQPSVGLTLSIPIYQNRQAKTSVAVAKIKSSSASLEEINVKNQLRKSIEQACVDVSSAQSEYQASVEQYNAANESYNVAAQKFEVGLINSVDFFIQKTTLISAESKLLQSKYNLVFSYKTLDFYLGKSLYL